MLVLVCQIAVTRNFLICSADKDDEDLLEDAEEDEVDLSPSPSPSKSRKSRGQYKSKLSSSFEGLFATPGMLKNYTLGSWIRSACKFHVWVAILATLHVVSVVFLYRLDTFHLAFSPCFVSSNCSPAVPSSDPRICKEILHCILSYWVRRQDVFGYKTNSVWLFVCREQWSFKAEKPGAISSSKWGRCREPWEFGGDSAKFSICK